MSEAGPVDEVHMFTINKTGTQQVKPTIADIRNDRHR